MTAKASITKHPCREYQLAPAILAGSSVSASCCLLLDLRLLEANSERFGAAVRFFQST